MKAFITGLVLIAISGAAIIWHLATRSGPPSRPQGPERTTLCMVWKAERNRATVWLCGSFHLLRPEDHPIPEPYEKAFSAAKILVTESSREPAQMADRQARSVAAGKLPPGETLEQRLSAPAWEALRNACSTVDLSPATLQPMKPWQAAVHLTNYSMQRLGYQPALGLETWFTAKPGGRTLAGLETLEAQLNALDTLDAPTQEAMLLRTAEEVKTARTRASNLTEAWLEGDTRRLAALDDGTIDALPSLKKALLDDRHAAWLPQLEKYLDGSDTVMILVGSRHLCGRGSLIELLEARGVKLTQMEYRTTRPAP
jgi:uncharacterized protein YbaP (TraB family)